MVARNPDDLPKLSRSSRPQHQRVDWSNRRRYAGGDRSRSTAAAVKTLTKGGPSIDPATWGLNAGNQEIAEYDGSGNLLRRYVYGPGLGEPLATVDAAGPASSGTSIFRGRLLGLVANVYLPRNKASTSSDC
jgi:hypothetical protein